MNVNFQRSNASQQSLRLLGTKVASMAGTENETTQREIRSSLSSGNNSYSSVIIKIVRDT